MDDKFTKVKSVELEILKEFMNVCDSLGLRWYAGYGTVLGAIRHGGFIPWDDDVDVVMPRKDYEVFCKKAQALLPENYFVQTLETEEEYYQPFAKVRRSDTTFWEEGTAGDHINHGIYMDIFPLDGYPTNWLMEKVFMLKRIVYDNCLYQAGDYNELHGCRKLIAFCYKVLKGTLSRKEAAKKKNKMVSRIPYDEGELVSCMVEDAPKAEAVPVEIYGAGREVEFEGISIRVPEQYEIYLEKLYGDYMQFPSEEKRVPIHTCIIIDTEKSYLTYQS